MNGWSERTLKQTKSIFISAGHSDERPGARGNNVAEEDFVLAFRDALAARLQIAGMSFNRDGQKGRNLPLRDAVKLARQHDIALEFHCNAFSTPKAAGVETLGNLEDAPFGDRLCEAISGAAHISNRGHKPEASGQHSRLAFISDGGGIIVELFFLTNPNDIQKFRTNLQGVLDAVADAIIQEATT